MDITTFLSTHQVDNENPVRAVHLHPKVKPDSGLGVFLARFGINSFSNGFLRTVDYDQLAEISSVWKWYDEHVILFMRTAFGGLFYKRKADFFFYDPLYDDKINLANDLEFALNYFLSDDKALDASFLFPLYKEAIPKTGVPEEDECLGFVPALKLGGRKDAGNLEVMKLKEHLYLLSQL